MNDQYYFTKRNVSIAISDFGWLGMAGLMELKSEMLTASGFFNCENKTHIPARDRMSRDSQHRIWNGYDWEIL